MKHYSTHFRNHIQKKSQTQSSEQNWVNKEEFEALSVGIGLGVLRSRSPFSTSSEPQSQTIVAGATLGQESHISSVQNANVSTSRERTTIVDDVFAQKAGTGIDIGIETMQQDSLYADKREQLSKDNSNRKSVGGVFAMFASKIGLRKKERTVSGYGMRDGSGVDAYDPGESPVEKTAALKKDAFTPSQSSSQNVAFQSMSFWKKCAHVFLCHVVDIIGCALFCSSVICIVLLVIEGMTLPEMRDIIIDIGWIYLSAFFYISAMVYYMVSWLLGLPVLSSFLLRKNNVS